MLNLYLKPTNYCTIGCEHCYLPEDVRANKNVMSHETLANTIKMSLDLAKIENHKSIHIIWHGGEPLMLKPSWFEEAGEVINSIIDKKYYTESIQTSLLPFNERWVNLIKTRFGGHIGSSVDFSQRKIGGKNETYLDVFMKRVKLARDNDLYVVPGMVPTKNEIGKGSDIVRWAIDNNFMQLNIERYSKFGMGQPLDWPNNRMHANFLIEVFDEVMKQYKESKKAIYINVVSAAIAGIVEQVSGDRWGTKCQREFLVIEPDGSLNTCPDRARHQKPFSNSNNGVQEFRESKERRNWIKIQDVTHKRDHCFNCEYSKWCKSACPVTPNGPKDGQEECSGFKTYLKHVEAFIERNKTMVDDYMSGMGENMEAETSLEDYLNG